MDFHIGSMSEAVWPWGLKVAGKLERSVLYPAVHPEPLHCPGCIRLLAAWLTLY